MPQEARASEGTRLLRLAYLAAKPTSRKEFGEKHGVDTPSYMSRLLSGDRSPGRALAADWVDTLGIPITAWDQVPTAELPSLDDPEDTGSRAAVHVDRTG